MVYPALLPLMPHLGCQQSTELTPLGRFKWTRPFRRQTKPVSARVPSHFNWPLRHGINKSGETCYFVFNAGRFGRNTYHCGELNHWSRDGFLPLRCVAVLHQLVELFFHDLRCHPTSQPAQGAFCFFCPATR